jgi:hypothetical protein
MGMGDWGLEIGDWAQSPIPIVNLINKKNSALKKFKIYKFIQKI